MTYSDAISTATFLMAFVVFPGVALLHRQNQRAWKELYTELRRLSRRQKRHDRRQRKTDTRLREIEAKRIT